MSAKLRGSLLVKGANRSPSGVTSLGDKIYITTGSKVIIYEAEAPYRRLDRTIKLPGSSRSIRMVDSLELAACAVSECLYINDLDSDTLWKVVPADDYALTKWLDLAKLDANKVSTSSRGEVLVLDTNHSCPAVSVYGPDAVLRRTVPIPLRPTAYSIRSPAVEILPDVVAVSFAFGDVGGIGEGIVVARLNETGQILREVKWGGLATLASHSLGRLIASDGSSQTLMILDCQLFPLQVVCLSKENGGSQWPRILCYRRETRELIVDHVGGLDGFRLDFYKLSYDEE